MKNISNKDNKKELRNTIRKTLENKIEEMTKGNLSPKDLLALISQNYQIRKMELNSI